MENKKNKGPEELNIIKQISNYEIQVILNRQLFEKQVIHEELYQIVFDKLLSKIQSLKEELQLVASFNY